MGTNMNMNSDKLVLFIVLNRVEKLDKLLEELRAAGIGGATVLNSIGMAHELGGLEDSHAISSFRAFFGMRHSENRTIFTIIDRRQVMDAREVFDRVVGDVTQPDTGIIFAVPAIFVEGIPADIARDTESEAE